MINNPIISIIIITYNSEQNLKILLPSIIEQTFNNFEIIVVDNDSKDGTIDYIKNNFKDIIIISNKKNEWFAKANNQGINIARGEYILIINDDTKLKADFLINIFNQINNNSAIGAIAPLILKLTENSNSAIIDAAGIAGNIFRSFKNIGENEILQKQYDQNAEVFGITGAVAFFRKKALDNIKINNSYFDEDYCAYKEDIDISYRLRLLGWKIFFCPSAIAYHKRTINHLSLSDRLQQNMIVKANSYRNHHWTIIKNEPFINLLIFAPFILFFELLKLIFILIFERSILCAYFNNISIYKSIFNKRKIIQREKKIAWYELAKWFIRI